jgi:hypothetical protein
LNTVMLTKVENRPEGAVFWRAGNRRRIERGVRLRVVGAFEEPPIEAADRRPASNSFRYIIYSFDLIVWTLSTAFRRHALPCLRAAAASVMGLDPRPDAQCAAPARMSFCWTSDGHGARAPSLFAGFLVQQSHVSAKPFGPYGRQLRHRAE